MARTLVFCLFLCFYPSLLSWSGAEVLQLQAIGGEQKMLLDAPLLPGQTPLCTGLPPILCTTFGPREAYVVLPLPPAFAQALQLRTHG